jgi:hypothetical protein
MTMNKSESTRRLSTRAGFALGISSAIVAALFVAFVMHQETSAGEPKSETPAVVASAAATPAAGDSLISGTIELDPSLANSVQGTMTVFVLARDGNSTKGHPIFAKRLDVTSFPAKFDLTTHDSMISGNAPSNVSLEARIDLDGDAISKEPNVPSAKIDSVALGARNVTLKLKLGA